MLSAAALRLCSGSSFSRSGGRSISAGCIAHCSESNCANGNAGFVRGALSSVGGAGEVSYAPWVRSSRHRFVSISRVSMYGIGGRARRIPSHFSCGTLLSSSPFHHAFRLRFSSYATAAPSSSSSRFPRAFCAIHLSSPAALAFTPSSFAVLARSVTPTTTTLNAGTGT